MRILIHAYTPVHPYFDGTGLRSFHVTPYLASRHTLDLIQERWPWENDHEPLSPAGYPDDWLETHYRRVWNIWHGPGEPLRYGMIRKSQQLDQLLDELLVPGAYDIIWATNEVLPYYVSRDKGRRRIPIVAGPTDSAHLQYRRGVKITHSPREIAWLLAKWALFTLYQVRVLNQTPFWVMVAEKDAASMRILSRSCTIQVIPYGVDQDWFRSPLGQVRDPYALVFVGTLGEGGTNEVSLEWFLTHVWPTLSQSNSQARLTIVGRNPSQSLRALCQSQGGVDLVGYVPDPRPYLWRSGIAILPMQIGAGIKNKLLEAWAAGCAVVSTHLGVEGVDQAAQGYNLLLAGNAQEMSMVLSDLMADPGRQQALAEGGRTTARIHYSWEASARKLESYLAKVIDQYPKERRYLP